jgi:hypothetical protein
MQVHADAFPLLKHGQTLRILMQTGILNRSTGIGCEHLNDSLVILGKSWCIFIFGQVNLPQLIVARPNGNTQQRHHERMTVRKAR